MNYKKQGFWLSVLLWLLFVLVLFIGFGVLNFYVAQTGCQWHELITCLPQNITLLGAVGDFLGGLFNPLVGFASFITLITMVVMQKRQLGLARDDLGLTRRGLADSVKAMNLQREFDEKKQANDRLENEAERMRGLLWRIYDERLNVVDDQKQYQSLSDELQQMLNAYEALVGRDVVWRYFQRR